jgi:hypothetical protein
MLEVFQVAGPVLAFAMVLALLLVLWALARLNRQQRLLFERLDTLEREQEQTDQGLALLSAKTKPQSGAL